MKTSRAVPLAVVGVFLAAAVAQAAYSLFGDAVLSSPGNASSYGVTVTSSSATDGFGGVSFSVPTGTTVGDLGNIESDYLVVAGDCGGGSPRFSIRVDMDESGGDSPADRSIFVYIGPVPNFTECDAGWQSTGNLLDDEDLRIDASQVGGAFYDTFAHAQTLVGSKPVLRITAVVDGAWVTDPQTFELDNVVIDGDAYDFEPSVPGDKDACRNGGWQTLTRGDFTPFKNQGDCVQYVNTGR